MWAKLSIEMTEIKMESGVGLEKRPSEVSVFKTGVTQYLLSFFFYTARTVHIFPCTKHFFFKPCNWSSHLWSHPLPNHLRTIFFYPSIQTANKEAKHYSRFSAVTYSLPASKIWKVSQYQILMHRLWFRSGIVEFTTTSGNSDADSLWLTLWEMLGISSQLLSLAVKALPCSVPKPALWLLATSYLHVLHANWTAFWICLAHNFPYLEIPFTLGTSHSESIQTSNANPLPLPA